MILGAISLFCLSLTLVIAQPGNLIDPDYTYIANGFDDKRVYKLSGNSGYTDLTFLPDKKGLLIAEKFGFIRYYSNFQESNTNIVVLDITVKVCINNERGLHSITLHPKFDGIINKSCYVFYTYKKHNNCLLSPKIGPVNRVSRFEFDIPKGNFVNETVLVETASLKDNMHNGGAIQFGSDGKLYVATGDGGFRNRNVTISPSNLLGSILRLNDDGAIPKDGFNPYQLDGELCASKGGKSSSRDAPCQEIYLTGLRNPFTIVMDPFSTDEVHFYVNDVGGKDYEEINEGYVNKEWMGRNYGWPIKEGPCSYVPRRRCVQANTHVEPLHWYTHGQEFASTKQLAVRAVVGGAFIPNDAGWPQTYVGEYLFIEYRLGIHLLLKHTELEDRSVFPPISNFDSVPIRNIDRAIRMKFGPCDDCGSNIKQALYYTTRQNAGELRRLTYIGTDNNAKNRSPVALLTVRLETGGDGLKVSLDASDSYDPDGSDKELTFLWKFGDGTEQIETSNPKFIYTYKKFGTYGVFVKVSDSLGASSTVSEEISVGIEPRKLINFIWNSDYSTCKSKGFDFCGVMEFCHEIKKNKAVYGYRNFGENKCDAGPGPVIRMEPNKRYKFTLSNKVGSSSGEHHPTNIHTHGLHIVGDGDGDDVTRVVHSDNCLDYTWDIPFDHPDGTYWYHPHLHGYSDIQINHGGFGMLIIENNYDLHGDDMPDWTTNPGNERLLQISHIDNVVLGNGNFQEHIHVMSDQWYRLRVSIVDPLGESQLLRFGSDEEEDGSFCDVYKVAADGVWHSSVPLPNQKPEQTFQLTGASRADFAIRCVGVMSFVDVLYAGEIAAIINIGTKQTNPYKFENWVPNRPSSLTNIATVSVPPQNRFNINVGQSTINGKSWNPNLPLKTISYDTTHEWTISDTIGHPFHTHLYHMLIKTPGGCGSHLENEFYDTISGPPCTVRFKTADIGQRFAFHCHVLQHQESGSMGWVDVQGPDMPVRDVDSPEYTCSSPPNNCSPSSPPIVLLTAPGDDDNGGDILERGKPIQVTTGNDEKGFLAQLQTGKIVFYAGQPGSATKPKPVWSTSFKGAKTSYFSTLSVYGVLSTYRGTPDNAVELVWSTGATGDKGTYFFSIDCGFETLTIYQGLPTNPDSILWSSSTNNPHPKPQPPPTPNPTDDNDDNNNNLDITVKSGAIMVDNDVLEHGEAYVYSGPGAAHGVFLRQQMNGDMNGRICLWVGSVVNAISTIWCSSFNDDKSSSSNQQYHTRLHTNGEFRTKEGSDVKGLRGKTEWTTNKFGERGDWVLFYDSMNNTISIYKGKPTNLIGNAVWTNTTTPLSSVVIPPSDGGGGDTSTSSSSSVSSGVLLLNRIPIEINETYIYSGVGAAKGVFLKQRTNGKFCLYKGEQSVTPHLDAMWCSSFSGGTSSSKSTNYFTRIHGNGKILTKKGTINNQGATVWSNTGRTGGSSYGKYLLYLNDDITLSVYKGTPTKLGTEIWNSVRLVAL